MENKAEKLIKLSKGMEQTGEAMKGCGCAIMGLIVLVILVAALIAALH